MPAHAAPPAVTLDDGVPALACGTRPQLLHGPALAVSAQQLAPVPAGEWGQAGPDAAVFRTTFDLATASGTLTRAAVVRDADGAVRLLDPSWDAAALLAATDPAQRHIYTSGPAGTVPFTWSALPDSLRALLDTRPPPGSGRDGLGEARVAWLRGDRTLEGTTFRRRASVLGDAVHGTPVYVGAAAGRYADSAYAAFARRARSRVQAVYLGANDGMLHAFDAAAGRELFAYVPALLAGALGELTAPAYVHRAYVDGPLAAGEAVIGGQWRSVLVGSTGGGAQGVFALDVTDPADFTAGLGALWEFTDRDDAALGNVMQAAQVARLPARSADGRPAYRYFAVVGNGLDSGVADGAADDVAGAGHGALFLLALDKPPAQPWRRDTNYYRIDTPPGDAALPDGLGAAAIVTDDNDVLRHAYAGDMQGNLWRFDFTVSAPWRQRTGWQPLFVARDAAGNRQPIAQQPKLVYAEGGGYLVLFGTGSLYGRGERDPAGFRPQSFYAIYDDPAAPARPAPLRRADLVERRADGTDDATSFVVAGRRATIGSGDRPQGWYLDFSSGAASGERSIASAVLVGGKLLFSTVVPGRAPCADSASRQYVLDALAGLPTGGDGLPLTQGGTGVLLPDFVDGQALLLPGPRNRSVRQPDGRVTVHDTTAVVRFGAVAGAALPAGASAATWPAGRLSWREVANWRQLHRFAVQGRAR
ncbi:type IV pilus assembly protein PilY1 [Pseudoduganella flava]|uniref:Type IV pilus assembly protein PilY1 n=1 Tax=Pseudoduganella flava TaxID=871742 RepID=A0A562PK06_9BURK|nr:type IV pilus assembly protein PilY1 [Pseudoduganella flava]